ncbi:MAG TPA: carboxypeptidase regulatory-like domain-containing protein, partial [Thermoanaerobaculia bacterium]
MSRQVLVVMALLVAMCTSAFAQSSTSGALTGRVSDNSGPVPGVTVELSSPSIQGGTRVAVTDSQGEFRFSLLPPGNYTLNATLSGYAPLKQENIAVGLSRTVQLELAMRPSSVTETITVTAEAPLVDVTSAASGANVTSETMETLPMRRDFYAVAQVAPGTSEDAAGTTVYGSTGAENQYIIDGLNTTSVELGVEGKTLNFDFIQEVAIRTGGLPAEYGRVTGGVIEAITKSGGNEFSGDVFGYSSGGGLRAEEATASERPGTTTTVADIDSQFDIGFDLGGYILRDRLWFFGAYNRVNETDTFSIIRDLHGAPGTPGIGSSLDQDITRDLYAGKLTWQITRNQNASLSVFGDPSEANGAVFGIAGPPVTFNGERTTGGNDLTARYSGVFGTNWLVSGIYGTHHEEDYTTGPGKLVPQIINQTVNVGDPVTVENGFGFHQDQEFDRDVMKLDVTRYLGNHELKIGG